MLPIFKDNIDNAIKRGTGQLDGVNYEELRYEGYGINGAAVIVDCLTDNKVRTVADQATYLRLAHTLAEFLDRLRTQTKGLDVLERQRVVRLLVKEVIVGDDSITIRHSIPTSSHPSGGPAGPLNPQATLARGDGSGQF